MFHADVAVDRLVRSQHGHHDMAGVVAKYSRSGHDGVGDLIGLGVRVQPRLQHGAQEAELELAVAVIWVAAITDQGDHFSREHVQARVGAVFASPLGAVGTGIASITFAAENHIGIPLSVFGGAVK